VLGQEKGQLQPARNVQDAEDIGQLGLHRCFADMEIARNLFVAGTGGNKLGYLPLTRGQEGKRAVRAAGIFVRKLTEWGDFLEQLVDHIASCPELSFLDHLCARYEHDLRQAP